MSLYIIEDDDGNVLDRCGEFNNLMINARLYDEPLEPESDVKEFGGHVVKLTEEQKVKLPRDVGEELEDWLKADSIDTIITDLVWLTDDHMAVRDWWESTPDATYLIADMARYGWEAEKEVMYNVKVPLLSNKWFIVNADGELDSVGNRNFATHFSMTAINEYGLQNCERVEVTDDDD